MSASPFAITTKCTHRLIAAGCEWMEEMKCPKCGHEQVSKIECERCGVIFEKFYKIQKQRQRVGPPPDSRAPLPASGKKRGPLLPIMLGLVIAIALAFGGYWHGLKRSGNVELAQEETPPAEPSPLVDMSDNPEEEEEGGIAQQLNDFKTPKNFLEKGQASTVFIETPWGLGSGFFIDKECRIITNKHVVHFEEEKITQIKYQIGLLTEAVRKEKGYINGIKEYEEESKPFVDSEGVNDHLLEWEQNLELHERQLEQLTSLYEIVKNGSDSMEFKVYLLDGSEHLIENVALSEHHDIALLEMDQEGCPPLTPNIAPLDVGQRVYTIGNPMGLSNTVTSGIVSGAREYEDVRYIQTDAPINSGNSGGPLIDEQGRVVGINTMILKDTEGIGFAIPIELAIKEFDMLN